MANIEQNKWYRFPIDVVEHDVKKAFELTGEEIPENKYIESWIDINIEQIVAIRKYIPKDSESEEITGTILYISDGSDWVVNVLPSKIREILNYKPIKVESIKNN